MVLESLGHIRPMEVRMRKTVRVRLGLVGVGSVLALVAVSATDVSACSRPSRVCGAYAPAPVYQYAPPPPAYYAPPPAYYAPPPAYYAPPNVAVGYGYGPPAYGYAPASGYYGYGYRNGNGYRNCDRGRGYRYAPPAAYDYDDDNDYRPAAVWAPVR
jgi:hypothetical protein